MVPYRLQADIIARHGHRKVALRFGALSVGAPGCVTPQTLTVPNYLSESFTPSSVLQHVDFVELWVNKYFGFMAKQGWDERNQTPYYTPPSGR